MSPLADALAPWHEFYALLGGASATMIALLFVAVSVGAGVFSSTRRAPLRAFLSATVVHFSSILAACLIVLAPIRDWVLFGGLILGAGMLGLVYSALVCRDTVRDGVIKSIDLEDRTWYLALPVVGYLLETASGAALARRYDQGCVALALSMGLLLVIAIHNAWDITVWSITRKRE